MTIADELKKPRNTPRDIDPERAWYYVNRGSVDLVLRDPDRATVRYRVPRRWLEAMLVDMAAPRPRRQRKAKTAR